MARHPDQNYCGAARDFSDSELAKLAHPVGAHAPGMKSIFEIQDGDAVEEEYSVPGYALTVRPVGSLLDGAVRLEVYFGGRHDHYLTSTLHRFDGEQRNRDLMVRVGLWLQKECARIGAPSDLTTAKRADEILERAILGDLVTPGCRSPRARERREAFADELRARLGEGGKAPWPDKSIQELAREQHEREIRESPEGAFLIECLRRDGVEVKSVSYDLLGDRFDVECRSATGQYFTAGVPVKAVRRGSVSQVQDHVRCPWCGSHETAGQVTVVCDDGVDRLFRRTCGACKDRTRDLEGARRRTPAATQTDRGIMQRTRLPLAWITGADSLGPDLALHTEPEFTCGLWAEREQLPGGGPHG